ncbi:putative RNA polymerase [Rio Grande virus]|uniref:RNA-directed RNA polymerase L n=1 Tax=Rio Grande virus TaxID=629740 RepID=A0A4P8D7T4_9VIRU|nr:putative RNA polymerase [Rio Grande virus]QCI62753.1 RNA-dependent RNA polymerase [Rio Grande virus]QEI46450.1 putative RNA polymerase [Rio Grande virus]
MNEILTNQAPLRQGFNKRELISYVETMYGAELPEFSLTASTKGLVVELDFDFDDQGSAVGSTLKNNPQILVEPEKMLNMIHDITVGHLAGTTDCAFSSVFPLMHDPYDGFTPDMIVETTGGTYHVVEFTTTRGGENAATRAAKGKMSKYEIACINRSEGNSISLFVISVWRGGVVSNLTLSDDEVNELVYRYRLALSIFEEASKVLPELKEDDEELSKLEREILGIVSTIKLDWDKTERSFEMFERDTVIGYQQQQADHEYVSRVITKVIDSSLDQMKEQSFLTKELSLEDRFSLNKQECEEKIGAFLSDLSKRDFVRDIYDSKATVQIPPWVCLSFQEGKGLNCIKGLNVVGDHPMSRIWYEVSRAADLDLIERMEDDPNKELQEATDGTKDRPDERNKYHRVRLDLDQDIRNYIGSLGVNGKQLRDSRQSKEARERSKKTFRIDHDTSALDKFLRSTSTSIYLPVEGVFSPFDEDYELRLAAQSIHQPDFTNDHGANEFIENHSDFSHSALGSWCQFVSLVGSELSASVKQHVKPGSFIVKRIKGSPYILLIKPTSSKGHIFVSFAAIKSFVHSDICAEGVFKNYVDSGDLYVTDFVSFKMSKLTNLCKCFSLIESALAFWTEANGREVWRSVSSLARIRSNEERDISFMTKLSLLTLMEDKATTEEIQTLNRYIIMEGFVSQPEIPKPHKMIGKLPVKLRTELQVYLTNRALDTMIRIASGGFKIRKYNGKISWSGLFNPFSGGQIRDLQCLISCCYNGYFKNKEEETEPSALSAMYKKIIELEHLCPETSEYLGRSDPENPKMHEFSRSYLKQCTDHAKHMLRKNHGPNVMDLIQNQIIRDLGSLTIEKLATLKATSNFNESWYDYKDVKDKNYTRDKLIVRMSEFANQGKSLAIQMFDECMRVIEDRRSMHICLFKKQQHGGLREIYVMGAEERIVQSVVESIAKSVGSFFPSDTLCNPANKTKIPESHGLRARKHCAGPVWTTATSDDARKWNQGHFVMKFALMLCDFTHRMWWPLIIRGCSMFTRKYMMMNLKYLEILDCHRELKVEDEFVMDLFRAYHGEIEVPWIDKGKTFLKTRTGMMQGILHFTSSLLHTIHQEFIRSLSFKIFNMKIGPSASQNIICDMMQGSDDSSMIISFPAADSLSLSKYKTAAALCFRVKKALGIFLAIYPSEKSTSNTDFVMEYNSEFYFHSQHIRPTIRWIAACCSLPEVETLIARQEEASNLMTSITEGGGSFSLAAQIQQSQCSLYYMLMGMGVSSLFEHFKEAILEWKDPGLGFFLLDNPYAAGLGGFRFNLYKTIKETKLKKMYSYFLKRVRKTSDKNWDESVIPETCSVSPGGALILSSSLKWGSRQKFYNLRDRLRIPDNWMDQINENPEILYRAPRTGDEIILRIAEKVHSPGVITSLSNGNAVSKVMASAVYFLSAAIFEDSGRREEKDKVAPKYSLLQKAIQYSKFDDVSDITQEEFLFLFPNAEELESLDIVVFNRGPIDIVQRISHRDATQTKIVVFDEYHSMRVSPEKLVSDKWFNTQKSRIGNTAFREEWDKLCKIVAWVRDKPDETLAASPLTNHVQIKNFFARMEGRARTVRVTGAPVKKRSGVSKLSMVIRDNFSKVGHLRDLDDVTGLMRSQVAELIKHYLFCILQGPYNDETKLHLTLKVFQSAERIEMKESDGGSRTNKIALFQAFCNNDPDLLSLIESAGAGTIGGFSRPQRTSYIEGKVYYHGPGTWRGVMDGFQVQIDIDNEVGKLPHITALHVSQNCNPWDLTASIRSWAEDLKAKNDVDMSRSKHLRSGYKYWMTGFKVFGFEQKFGCPVYTFRERIVSVSEMDVSQVRYKIRSRTINLYIKEGRGDLHILSYTAGDQDISPSSLKFQSGLNEEMSSFFSKEPSSSWLSCTPLPYGIACKVLKLLDGSVRLDHINSDILGRIIRTCTESSLRSKVGTVFSHLPCVEQPVKANISEMISLMIDEMDDNNFDDIAMELEEELSAGYDNDNFDLSDIDLFGPAHYKELSEMALVSHPLMDLFIEYIIDRAKRKEIRRALETCKVLRRNKDMISNLFKALGRDPRSLITVDTESDDTDSYDDDILG